MDKVSRIVTVVAALFMLVGGGVAAATMEDALWSTSGAVFVALGSALLSLSISELRSLQRAKKLLAPHLEPVCDQFLEAISQLRQTTKDFRDGSIEAPTAGELIAAHASSLESALRNLHAYSGAKGDKERIRRSRKETDLLEDLTGQPMRLTTVESRTSSSESNRHEEIVPCPNCGAERTVELGLNVGDSAMTTCRQCQLRFHVHRDRHGDAFTKPWGSGSGRQFDFWCPSCRRHRFRFRITGEVHPRYCLECFAKVLPTDDGGEVVQAPAEPTVGTLVVGVQDYGRSVLDCECGHRCTAFYTDGRHLYAVCDGCDRLVRALVEDGAEGGGGED